jgi:hypothetical protein
MYVFYSTLRYYIIRRAAVLPGGQRQHEHEHAGGYRSHRGMSVPVIQGGPPGVAGSEEAN